MPPCGRRWPTIRRWPSGSAAVSILRNCSRCSMRICVSIRAPFPMRWWRRPWPWPMAPVPSCSPRSSYRPPPFRRSGCGWWPPVACRWVRPCPPAWRSRRISRCGCSALSGPRSHAWWIPPPPWLPRPVMASASPPAGRPCCWIAGRTIASSLRTAPSPMPPTCRRPRRRNRAMRTNAHPPLTPGIAVSARWSRRSRHSACSAISSGCPSAGSCCEGCSPIR